MADRHPFQLHILPGPRRPYELIEMDAGLFVRLDMPGVPRNGLKITMSSEKNSVTLRATAPKKDSFPFDESERSYAGVLRLTKDPNDLVVDVFVKNGSVFMFFPTADGYLLFMSHSSLQGEGDGSSSGESIDKAEEKPEENEDSSEKPEENEDSSKKPEENEDSSETSKDKAEGLEKSEENEDSSKKSVDKVKDSAKSEADESASIESTEGSNCEGLEKSEENEDSSENSIDEAEGSVKSGSDDSASDDSAEGTVKSKSSSEAIVGAWLIASIKAYLLSINTPEPPKEESALVETYGTEQSNHEMPEIAIGSVEEMDIHDPHCQCQRCGYDGVYVKTWSTTENNIGYTNKLKVKGPDGVCEKRVVQEGGQYSLYVRADLPGVEPPCNVVPIKDRCIMVFGVPRSLKRCRQGARIYLFFVQLQCSCCKFDNLCHDFEDGVFRLSCKIIGPEPGPSAE